MTPEQLDFPARLPDSPRSEHPDASGHISGSPWHTVDTHIPGRDAANPQDVWEVTSRPINPGLISGAQGGSSWLGPAPRDPSSRPEPATHTMAHTQYVVGTSHLGSGWATNRAWWSNPANHWEEGNGGIRQTPKFGEGPRLAQSPNTPTLSWAG